MHKKHIFKNNDLTETKEAINNKNAKVTVQYIQNQQLFQKPYNNNLVHASTQDDIEIENVEYLEENTNMEEYVDESGDKEIEDNFYPNAVYCLLDLYKIKSKSLTTDFKVAQLWRDIAKDMQESFFEFSEYQIQHKYVLLRAQYFAVQTKEDIENFDYFQQLHDIYKDIGKDNIAKSISDAKDSIVYYKDEEHDTIHDFKSKEIVHKEHEFIDMVEKELQAMEDGIPLEDKDSTGNEVKKKDGKQCVVLNKLQDIENVVERDQPNIKTTHLDSENCKEPPQKKTKLNDYFEYNDIIQEPSHSTNINSKDFTLYHYNLEQERRHQEKMSLLDKNLQMQERALEQQQQLLQELIKRLP